MPQVSDFFGPIYSNVTLDGSGNGSVSFTPNGAAARVSNIFFKVATSAAQAVVTIYKGQVAEGNIIFNSNSGSTGGNAKGNVDLFDGETVFVKWTGGDAGATATATFTGQKIPFQDMRPTLLTFDDPIAAGDGSLIYPALKSPNYSGGVSGWQISRTGDAEFNNVTIRGTFIANGSSNSYIRVSSVSDTPNISFRPADPIGGNSSNVSNGVLGEVTIGATLAASYFRLALIGAGWSGAGPADFRYPTIYLQSASYDGTTVTPNIYIGFNNNTNVHTVSTTIDSNTVINGDITYGDYNVNTSKGWVTGNGVTSDSTAAAATEVTVVGTSAFTFKAGRAYKIVAGGMVKSSVAATSPVMRFRKDDGSSPPSGQVLDVWRVFCNVANTTYNAHFTGYFRCTSDVPCGILISIVGSGAFNATYAGGAQFPASINIYDIGAASNFTWAPLLT